MQVSRFHHLSIAELGCQIERLRLEIFETLGLDTPGCASQTSLERSDQGRVRIPGQGDRDSEVIPIRIPKLI
jgi:hypothetical protein